MQASYDTLVADTSKLQKFKQDIVESVAAAANVSMSAVEVVSIKPGSVVAEVRLLVPAAEATPEKLAEISKAVSSNPDALFDDTFRVAYGVWGVSVVVVSDGMADAGAARPLTPGQTAGIVIGVLVGSMLLVAVLVAVTKRRRGSMAVCLKPLVSSGHTAAGRAAAYAASTNVRSASSIQAGEHHLYTDDAAAAAEASSSGSRHFQMDMNAAQGGAVAQERVPAGGALRAGAPAAPAAVSADALRLDLL
jgi:hypothetical protein